MPGQRDDHACLPGVPAPYIAAVVQAAPIAFDAARSIERVADLCADVARRGASVALFPEAFVSAIRAASTLAR